MTAGAPTKYNESLCDKAEEYLSDQQDKERDVLKMVTAKGGEVFDKKLTVKLPTISGFALYLGVSEDSMYEWAKLYPKFSEALRKIKAEQQKRLLNKGLSGDYNSTIAKLILSANHGMREKSDVTSDDKPIQGNTIVFENFKKDDTEGK